VGFYGDLFFYSPAVQSLNSHAFNNHKTKQFQYMDRRRSGFCSLPLEYYPWFKEAGHGAELQFLFPMRFNITSSADDMSFPMTMMKYWSNFANTGYVLSCTNEMKRWILLLSLTHYERPLPTIDNVTNRR
jgi:carboxylesterase type B